MDETDTDAEETEATEAVETEEPEAGEVIEERVTAPMQDFGGREVTIGFVVLAIGLVVAFLLPLAF